MWSNSKYSPIKKKNCKFPPLSPRSREGGTWRARCGLQVSEAVVSSPNALSQQDLQQVIKSKYSREKSPRVRKSSAAPGVGVRKGRFCCLTLCLPRKADTISEVRKKPSYEYWIGGVVGPRLWKLTCLVVVFFFCRFCFSTSVLNSKCFSIYKDALQIRFLAK